LVVVGDNCGGQKTSLLCSYYLNSCPDVYYKGTIFRDFQNLITGYVPTIFDNNVLNINTVTLKEVSNIELGIWDTSGFPKKTPLLIFSGHEEFERLRPLTYASTHVFLLVFSVIEPSTLEHCEKRWFPEIKTYCPDASILLVGVNIESRFHVKAVQKLKLKNQRPLMPSDVCVTANYFWVTCAGNFGGKENECTVFRVQ
jgi:GTPase SAR1 family protein